MDRNYSYYTNQNIVTVAKEFDTNLTTGLSTHQANSQLKQYGKNLLEKNSSHWLKVLIRQFKSSFVYLLLGAALLSYVLAEKIDSIVIVLFIGINVFLGFLQEYKSEKSAELLKKYVSPKSKVKRDGVIVSILAEDVVPGDIIILEAGDIVPADARIISCNDFEVDESTLTGESVQAYKNSEETDIKVNSIYKASNIVFTGTKIIEGKAEALVFANVKSSEFGKAVLLSASTKRSSLFEKEISDVSVFILKLVGFSLFSFLIVAYLLKGSSYFTEQVVLFAIALAVSVIPEALPTVVTFSLTSGALALAKKKVIVKRLVAIKDFGSINVLCTDKTGTITENDMEVDEIFSHNKEKTLEYAAYASDVNTKEKESNNSFDLAIIKKLNKEEIRIAKDAKIINEIPFDPKRKRNSVLIKINGVNTLIVRGAPETVLHYCTIKDKEKYFEWTQQQGAQGKRVLALAEKPLKLAVNYNEKNEESGLEFIGLISFVDPIKKTAKHTIAEALELGVQVKIITGDSLEVAGAVAKEIGLVSSISNVVSGDTIERLQGEDLITACSKYHVFARVTPEQKHKIISTLNKRFSVGFLGEGINDAPALKAATVGIAVSNASDIARDAADILLLKKSLEVLVDGIKEGRKVFSNTSEYLKATLTSNFGNFFALIISGLLLDYLPMLPLQILLLNLLSDFPMIAIAGDNIDKHEMENPSKFDFKGFTMVAISLGLVSTIFDLMFFFIFKGEGAGTLHTAWFIGSVLTELAFIFSIRTRGWFYKAIKPSNVILVLISITYLVTITIPYTVLGSNVFSFIKLPLTSLAVVLGLVLAYFISTELVKVVYYKKFKNHI